jgi:hypothetical protein
VCVYFWSLSTSDKWCMYIHVSSFSRFEQRWCLDFSLLVRKEMTKSKLSRIRTSADVFLSLVRYPCAHVRLFISLFSFVCKYNNQLLSLFLIFLMQSLKTCSMCSWPVTSWSIYCCCWFFFLYIFFLTKIYMKNIIVRVYYSNKEFFFCFGLKYLMYIRCQTVSEKMHCVWYDHFVCCCCCCFFVMIFV